MYCSVQRNSEFDSYFEKKTSTYSYLKQKTLMVKIQTSRSYAKSHNIDNCTIQIE